MGDYPSFDDIIRIEYQRWLTTDKESKVKLDKLVGGGVNITYYMYIHGEARRKLCAESCKANDWD